MVNEEHLVKLTEGVNVWNEWRKNSPDIRPDLRGAKLKGVNLRGAELKGVNLQGAQLQEANLRWGQLQGANLQEADLRGADLYGANLCGANLQGADLRDVEGLTKGQIESARIDDKTKLPDGLRPSE